jgi:hypothetical protein
VWDSSLRQDSRKRRGVAGVIRGTSWITNPRALMCLAGGSRGRRVRRQGMRCEGYRKAMLSAPGLRSRRRLLTAIHIRNAVTPCSMV